MSQDEETKIQKELKATRESWYAMTTTINKGMEAMHARVEDNSHLFKETREDVKKMAGRVEDLFVKVVEIGSNAQVEKDKYDQRTKNNKWTFGIITGILSFFLVGFAVFLQKQIENYNENVLAQQQQENIQKTADVVVGTLEEKFNLKVTQ